MNLCTTYLQMWCEMISDVASGRPRTRYRRDAVAVGRCRRCRRRRHRRRRRPRLLGPRPRHASAAQKSA
eukprot:5988120-Pleurochrysis_carterae.AAC.1